MRTFRAMSFLQQIVPAAYISLCLVLFWGAVFGAGCVGCNHYKGMKGVSRSGIILIAIGACIILIGCGGTYDALKYTHGSKKAIATITGVNEKYYSIEEETDYIYTLEFHYEKQAISVKMTTNHKMPVSKGEAIDVYFYPESLGSNIEAVVVAVDIEVRQARKNIIVGCVACIIGGLFLCYAAHKRKLLNNGFSTTATVIQSPGDSFQFSDEDKNTSRTFACQGKNPVTGLPQIFRTKGVRRDFMSLSRGDTVHVFISKADSHFYIINI